MRSIPWPWRSTPSLMNNGDLVSADSMVADFESYLEWHERTGALHTVNYEAAYTVAEDGEREYAVDFTKAVLDKVLAMSNGAGFSVGVKDWPRSREELAPVAELQAYPHFGILVDLGELHLNVRDGP